MKMILLSLAIIVAVYFGPLAIIWSLNTIFPVLEIPYSLQTWAAVVVLISIFSFDPASK